MRHVGRLVFPLSLDPGTSPACATGLPILQGDYVEQAHGRSNFEIRHEVLVDRVLLSGTRAHGVLTAAGEELNGDMVVVCGGTYSSPAILLLSMSYADSDYP